MATTASILLKIAEFLRDLRYGTATGGNATTLVDTNLDEPTNDYFNNGTIWFLSGNNIGKSAVITDYNSTTHTFTFVTPGAACAAADRYAILSPDYRREALVSALNTALAMLGPFDGVDETLDAAADTESYAIPSGIVNIKRMEYATASTSPYGWKIDFHWRELGGRVYVDKTTMNELSGYVGYPIRLYGEKPHASVWADADVITDTIHPSRLALEAAYYAALTRSGMAENTDGATKNTLERLAAMRQATPAKVYHMAKDPIFPRW